MSEKEQASTVPEDPPPMDVVWQRLRKGGKRTSDSFRGRAGDNYGPYAVHGVPMTALRKHQFMYSIVGLRRFVMENGKDFYREVISPTEHYYTHGRTRDKVVSAVDDLVVMPFRFKAWLELRMLRKRVLDGMENARRRIRR